MNSFFVVSLCRCGSLRCWGWGSGGGRERLCTLLLHLSPALGWSRFARSGRINECLSLGDPIQFCVRCSKPKLLLATQGTGSKHCSTEPLRQRHATYGVRERTDWLGRVSLLQTLALQALDQVWRDFSALSFLGISFSVACRRGSFPLRFLLRSNSVFHRSRLSDLTN